MSIFYNKFISDCKDNDELVMKKLNCDELTSDMLKLKNNYGFTPLMIACTYNHKSVQHILNCDKFTSDMLNQKTNNGWTPLMIACEHEHDNKSVQYILNHRNFTSDMLNQKTNNAWTPLMIACQFCHDFNLIKKIISMCSTDTLKLKCNEFNINNIKTNNLMKEYAGNGGQTFLHILAIFNPKIFFEIKNIIEFDLLNIVDNSGLVCSHYVSIDTICSDAQKLLCPICFDKSDDINVYNPCGHIICGNCAKSYDKLICYMCKSIVTKKTKIYF